MVYPDKPILRTHEKRVTEMEVFAELRFYVFAKEIYIFLNNSKELALPSSFHITIFEK